MATAKAKVLEKPKVQIDDLVREMTDEEFSDHLLLIENSPKAPE
jgi:hypothetical protein